MIGLVNALFLKSLEEPSWEYIKSDESETSLDSKFTVVLVLLGRAVVVFELVLYTLVSPNEKLVVKINNK
jgi:hypothetical protein